MENNSQQGEKKSSSRIEEKNREELTEVVDQDPGERQKENQNQSKDDPLAA